MLPYYSELNEIYQSFNQEYAVLTSSEQYNLSV